jgi:RNA polymerase subunit RPABC4/transcription elongation factor Spt4
MITCPDCHAVVKEEHDTCPLCGGLLHASEEQRAVAHAAEAERSRAAAREARDAIHRKDDADGHFARLGRITSSTFDSLDEAGFDIVDGLSDLP